MTASALQRVFKNVAKKAGLPKHFSFHATRYTFAVVLYEKSDYNLRIIQQQLGHSSPSTSAVYLTVSNKHLTEAVEKM
ncbi:tyrosine-type recombinase/integrase [bacterium]|nr:tyrosine-type recombinase/integrase [bacterium]